MSTSRRSSRLTWDEVWAAVATTVGDRSLCVRDQVGAVIVDPTQRIIATGYNGPPANFPHGGDSCVHWCSRAQRGLNPEPFKKISRDMLGLQPETALAVDYADCPALHAEANALAVCDRRDREGGTMFVTSHVCFACAKLVANSGLVAVYVDARGGDAAHRDPTRSYEFLRDCGLGVFFIAKEVDVAAR